MINEKFSIIFGQNFVTDDWFLKIKGKYKDIILALSYEVSNKTEMYHKKFPSLAARNDGLFSLNYNSALTVSVVYILYISIL